jgi:nucleoside-triphosphatase
MTIWEQIKQNFMNLISWAIPILGVLVVITKIFLGEEISIDFLLSSLLVLFSFDTILMLLVKKKEKGILDNIINKINIDNVFSSENEQEKKIIENAKSELCILQETGFKFTEDNMVSLRSFLENEGSLKIVVCADDKITISQLLLRNDDLNTYEAMHGRFATFLERIRNLSRSPEEKRILEKITIRQCPYPIGITLVIDNSKTKQAVIRWADFKVPYEKKNDLDVNKEKNPKIYDFYCEQFFQYFRYSYKIILLTGSPRIGKTSLFKDLIDNNIDENYEDDVFYFYSKEILNEAGDRIGFNVHTSYKPELRLLAKEENNKYKVNIDILNEIADEIIVNIRENKKKIFIIDEIGLMQLESEKFVNAIKEIFKEPTVTLFATISKEDDGRHIISSLKENPRAYCIQYNNKNKRYKILGNLNEELNASLKLYKTLKLRG